MRAAQLSLVWEEEEEEEVKTLLDLAAAPGEAEGSSAGVLGGTGHGQWGPQSGCLHQGCNYLQKNPSELDLKYQICEAWGLWLPTKGRNGEEGGCRWGASPRGPRGHPCAEAAGSDLGSVATLLKAAQSLNTIISQFALNN